jgi:hypothetical protein
LLIPVSKLAEFIYRLRPSHTLRRATICPGRF